MINQVNREVTRLVLLILAMSLFFWMAKWLPMKVGVPELAPFLTSTALVLGLAAVTQMTRRVLAPSLDFQKLAKRAAETPLGAGLVVLGLSLIVVALLAANTAMLR